MRRDSMRHASMRNGTIVPLLVVSLITLLLIAAWVIDRAWVSSAYGELVAATESSAHAAAVELLDDTRLTDVGEELRLLRARHAAAALAGANRVAGQRAPVDINRDVLFAKSLDDAFEPDVVAPTVVAVRIRRNERQGNPLGLLLSGLGGVPHTNIDHTATVRIENRLAGLAASESQPAPLLPIGIVESGSEGIPGWNEMIVQQLGEDEFSYDRDDNTVLEEPDGITEIAVLLGEYPEANGLLVSRNGFSEKAIVDIVQNGETQGPIDFANLSDFETEIASAEVLLDAIEEENLIGRERLILLTNGVGITQFVAGRIMAIDIDQLERRTLIIQPCVMTLGQATLAKVTADQTTLPKDNVSERDAEPNPYLFKIVTVR